MPILLDDIDSVTQKVARAVTPHFFSSELTGRGKSTGLINEHLRPGRAIPGRTPTSITNQTLSWKSKSSANSVTVREIPFAPLTIESTLDTIRHNAMIAVPSSVERFHVTSQATMLDFDVFFDLTPQGAILTEDGSGDKIVRRLDVLYRMEVYVLDTGSTSEKVQLMNQAPHPGRTTLQGAVKEFALVEWSFAPLDDAEELIARASAHLTSTGRSVHVDVAELAAWMADYDVYERICRQAETWSSAEIGQALEDHIQALFAQGRPTDSSLNVLAHQLRYLEMYSVPLDAYRQVYQALVANCPQDVAEVLAKQNLNLLMNETLANLESLKPQLAVQTPNAQAMQALPAHFSAQQRNAICTDEPLSMTVAGAGTGKSTTILGRIDYLMACGVEPEDITVLSFTNAAADNITARNPRVGSMTIARMVLDIYSMNYPTHQISTIDTMVNTMDILFPNNDMVAAFRRRLIEVDKNADGATTALNTFVEQHFDEVIYVLDRIEQTCLELQIIIAYQRIDQMVEPPHVTGRFLIVDEVQDNSIFEFIYLLRYVAKHRQNLFIVGDASQTLYEFRSANPKALNALEGSGVFATYKLTTNYRSNQEILDFANVHLAEIEANALAQIRLQANSLAQPTAASFKEKVRLHYYTSRSQSYFLENELPGIMQSVVKPYVDECLSRGEKVAFLAYRGKAEVKRFEKLLTEMYPGRPVTNLTSERRRPTTIFSQFVKAYWNDVCQVPPASAAMVVAKGIIDNLDALVGRSADKVKPIIANFVSEWWVANADHVNGWVALHQAGQLAKDQFFENLMRNLLDYEIEQNGIKQNILNLQNRQRKELNASQDADLIVSTIHGAKGLEFDNVVVLHTYDTELPEDRKRMYYVAFTRAMKSEMVISAGRQKNPRIKANYDLIVTSLRRHEALEALRDSGVDVDQMPESDLEELVTSWMKNQEEAETSQTDSELVTA